MDTYNHKKIIYYEINKIIPNAVIVSFATLTASIGIVLLSSQNATAADVKLTFLGSMEGEFCQFDRAMIFDDLDGMRLRFDTGRTLVGAKEAGLGKVDVILVSHIHGDSVGDKHIAEIGNGACSENFFLFNIYPIPMPLI
jgi:hypothetical protein